MEIASKYNPVEVEGKWYQYWLDNGFFKSKPDGREPYTIVIPPPNVTGVLHMGHMLNIYVLCPSAPGGAIGRCEHPNRETCRAGF